MRADIERLDRPIGPRKLPELRASYVDQCRRLAPAEDAPPGTFTRQEALCGSLGKLVPTCSPLIYARRDFTAVMVDAMKGPAPSDLPEMVDALIESDSGGFLYLEEPLKIADEGGKDAAMRLIVWAQSSDLLLIEMLGFDDQGELVSTMGVVDYGSGRTDGGHVREDEVSTVMSTVVIASLIEQGGIIEREDVDMRPLGKKGKRRRVDRDVPQVSVIDLRRSVAKGLADVAEAERTYRHRWIVRGHWRNQPYGPGRSERRRTYVAPYVKGPDGAPLLQHEKVYRW